MEMADSRVYWGTRPPLKQWILGQWCEACSKVQDDAETDDEVIRFP
jgi:hypothetical protein